jgi:hypothetical protein
MTGKPAQSTATLAPDDLQNYSADSNNPQALREAIDLAFQYRGDVTIVRHSDKQAIEGYLFDRRFERQPQLRLIPKDSDSQIVIPLEDVCSITFSGKDTASGKSFENWIRKYAQKKLAGETASIESESLDE